jgi:hypothetical protein
MTGTRTEARVTNGRRGRPSLDVYFTAVFALLTLLLQTYALIAEATRASQAQVLVAPTIPYIFLIVELCLTVNVVALWRRKAAGLVSLLALAGVGAGYLLWHVYSRQVLALLSSKSFYQLHPEAVPAPPLDLIGATWLNVIVLVMTGVLFTWEVKQYVVRSRPACE